MRILIVDDDKIARRLLRGIIGSDPRHRLVEAGDGPEALWILRQDPVPDLCILDNKMPGMDGIEVLEKMREDARLVQLPVIMVTSSKDVAVVTKAARLRVNYYILKPFDPKLVRAQVAKFDVPEPAPTQVPAAEVPAPEAPPPSGAQNAPPVAAGPAEPPPSAPPAAQVTVPEPAVRTTLSREQIDRRLSKCTLLPSLGSINNILCELVNAEQRYTLQISEVIRQDPSLTTRMLRLVNSVYYGLSTPVTSMEEAIFYLGIRQVRELALATPIIEDLQKAVGQVVFPWHEFWRHCIGTAILTREIVGAIQPAADEADYLAGLLHDVGRIVMAAEFPASFAEVCRRAERPGADMPRIEREVFGLDHCELGALYLERHRLPPPMVEVARFHAQPALASGHRVLVGAVQLANLLARCHGIGHGGDTAPVSEQEWLGAEGWTILFPKGMKEEQVLLRANLNHCLERLPHVLEAII